MRGACHEVPDSLAARNRPDSVAIMNLRSFAMVRSPRRKSAPKEEAKLTLSQRMARIRKTDTKPEMAVRQWVHRLGYRYRLGGANTRRRPRNRSAYNNASKDLTWQHGFVGSRALVRG